MDDVLKTESNGIAVLPLTVSLGTAILLAVAVFELPYAYYVFLRIEVTAVFLWAAYLSLKSGLSVVPWISLGLAILFNPIEKIYLDRTVWFYIDLASAAYILIVHFLLQRKSSGKLI